MSDGRSIGEPLRRALAGARLRDIDVAKTLGVDPKTVQRWLGGRLPQPRHRWGLADLLSLHEYDLWPHLAGVPSIGPEVYATYPHRGSVPRDVWRQLYHSAEQQIDILVYSGLFLAEDVWDQCLASFQAGQSATTVCSTSMASPSTRAATGSPPGTTSE
jgi:hypothetical protein